MNDSTTAQDLRPGQANAGPEQAGPEQPAQPIDAQVRAAIKRIARVPRLLVACDYDGTLAPIVEVPTKAVPLPESVAAVRSLASLSDTTVAVISGRALRDLAAMSRLPSEVHLVGSHGSEFDVDFVDALDPEHRWLRDQLQEKLTRLVRDEPGVRLELKPASIAVHTRGADRAVAERVVAAVEAGPASWPRIQVTRGKEVIELSVIETNKGSAVNALRGQFAAAAVMYLGDDVTDENAFRVLHAQDIGIKVGPAVRVPQQVAARRAGGADRAALDAVQRQGRGAGDARLPDHLALPSPPGLRRGIRQPARRHDRRLLLGTPGAGRPPAAGPAVPARDDDRGDPVVRRDRDGLARPRAGEWRTRRRVGADRGGLGFGRHDAGTHAHRHYPGPGRVRPAPRLRSGARHPAGGRRRPARAGLQRADRAALSGRRLGDHR